MNTCIDISDHKKMREYEELQYDNFLELSNLFEEYIFKFDLKIWNSIVRELENVLSKCDKIDYQSDSTAIAYSVWHFLDRYHRMQIMCTFLLKHGYLNREKKYNVLDVGTGPSQVLFALSDHFQSLNCIEKKKLCKFNPDYVEQSQGFRNFLHHFVEFALLKEKQYLVPFHFGRTLDAFEINFDEPLYDGFRFKNKYIRYRYDINVFSNFLTNDSFVERYADTLKKVCKYTRNHGLIIIIGDSEQSEKYRKVYATIDEVILEPVRDRKFYNHWDKVINQEFNYKYNDKYGEVIGDYFKNLVRYLQENDLWNSVPQNAQKEFLKNSQLPKTENITKEWKGITWKMVVYRKKSKPKLKRKN